MNQKNSSKTSSLRGGPRTVNSKNHGRASDLRCACYHIVTPQECMALRYGYDLKHDGTDETCECTCHDDDENDERDFYREHQL